MKRRFVTCVCVLFCWVGGTSLVPAVGDHSVGFLTSNNHLLSPEHELCRAAVRYYFAERIRISAVLFNYFILRKSIGTCVIMKLHVSIQMSSECNMNSGSLEGSWGAFFLPSLKRTQLKIACFASDRVPSCRFRICEGTVSTLCVLTGIVSVGN